MKAENELGRFGLKEATINQIISVFSQYPQIHEVLLYGSRAKGNYRNGSDIDLTLIGDVSYSQLSGIEDKIDDLLLPYSFDISIFSDIDNLDLINSINRIGVVFYEKDNVMIS
ncbi:MAG: nucleotidyltransferase domain-containing protein [Pseudanabaena sp. CAN_BIN31]|nr:nucleotidyltransferase domain-containing protein [Pseudanabaena sp. CAN_BIN31]